MTKFQKQTQQFEDILFDTTRTIVETHKTDKFNSIHVVTLSDENNNILATKTINPYFTEIKIS